MTSIKHLAKRIKPHQLSRKPLYILAFMVLFWAIYDGIITFVSPLIITGSGLSGTMMGIIIGTSSISGALFDFIACRIFKNLLFRRMFLIMFVLCFFYPFLLYSANTFWLYLIAMAIWGIYYDLKNFGEFNFIGRHIPPSEHSSGFGILHIFKSLGYLIAPILAGFTIGYVVGWKPLFVASIFLLISFIFFIYLLSITKKLTTDTDNVDKVHQRVKFYYEVALWEKIGSTLLPVLILTLLLNFIDSFFWTIGPLLAEGFQGENRFSGFFMTAYSLPMLLMGWFIGPITEKFGKKRTAIVSLLGSSILLSTLFLYQHLSVIIGVVFMSSIFLAMAWPSINGAYADYIHETADVENEIEGLQDLFTNLGYIIGPILAGALFDLLGGSATFSALGVFCAISAVILLTVTPKHIRVRV